MSNIVRLLGVNHRQSIRPVRQHAQIGVLMFVLFALGGPAESGATIYAGLKPNGDIFEASSYANLIAGSGTTYSTVHAGWEGIASDGNIWALYDAATGLFGEFSSLFNLRNNISGATHTSTQLNFESIETDGTNWIIYDNASGGTFKEYSSFFNLRNNIGGVTLSHSQDWTGFDGLASDGLIWSIEDKETGLYYKYSSLTSLLAGSGGILNFGPSGFTDIAFEMAVPEPGVVMMLGLGGLMLLGRRHKKMQ